MRRPVNALIPLAASALLLSSCEGPVPSPSDIFALKAVNPEPNIPLECYTDTGVVREGRAVSNPCYVCHTKANTPYATELEDTGLTFFYSFPEEILERGNPWLNAVNPALTLSGVPTPSDSEVEKWIRSDNWLHAYSRRGSGGLEYFPDVPPIYSFSGSYSLINIDGEGFLLDPQRGERTGWRAFRWKPFPGFFPTNGRIDSTFIRLPEKFRTSGGKTNWDTYKKNLAIVECAVKGVKPGEVCTNTEVGDFRMPARYEGDASDVEVITYQHPPGTEFAHPIYYLDPDNTISFKSLRLKEMRYMRKLSYASTREREEEEGEAFFWDNGLVVNASGHWIMVGFIETFWRKLPGSAGWMDQDYNLTSPAIRDTGYAAVNCMSIDSLQLGEALRRVLKLYCSSNSAPPGEYALYFALTGGGDHFRSNSEILGRISKDPARISLVLSPSDNILSNPLLINYLNPDGTVKPDLFLPSRDRAYALNGQYYRVVKAQAFVYGRDLFGKPFGLSAGGNSIEIFEEVGSTGVSEAGIWVNVKTLLK